MYFLRTAILKLFSSIIFFLLSFSFLKAQEFHDSQNFNNTHSGFIENKGQIYDQKYNPNPEVRYLLNTGKGLNVQLKTNSFSYDTYIIEKKEMAETSDSIELLFHFNKPEKIALNYHFHRVDIEFVNANPLPEIIAEYPSTDYFNYYNSVTPESGATFVRYYQKVTYKNIYPQIDLEFTTRPDSFKPFEYNFIIHPGGDAKQIRLKYKGADSCYLKDDKILINTAYGYFFEKIPASFLSENNKKINIKYLQSGSDEFVFKIPKYNQKNTLIIDPYPYLVWATYYGGSGVDRGEGISADNIGNLYISGSTSSLNAIATSGSFQSVYRGNSDIFILMMDTSGKRIWATYYGGDSTESYSSIINSDNNNIFLCGVTRSSNVIATSSGHQTSFSGSDDIFIVKFNNSGLRIWGTYFGGKNEDYLKAIVVDLNENLYIAGNSSSSGLSTLNAYQDSLLGNGSNGIIAKFNKNGLLLWASYYGEKSSYLGDITLNHNNDCIYLCGSTNTSYNIASPSSFQEKIGGAYDALIAKFDTSGKRIWATYYGGTGLDFANGIIVDTNNFIYFTGLAQSIASIATSNSYQPVHSGGFFDSYLVKFDSSGKRIWATYFGGNNIEEGFSLCYLNKKIIITGTTKSVSKIATNFAYQKNLNGIQNVYLACFDSLGNLCWGTYYGGNSIDADFSLDIISYFDNSFYLCSHTTSDSNIATPNSFQKILFGNEDAFIAKFIEIKESIFDTIIVSACDSFYFNNQYLTKSGTYFDTIKLPCNCDSIIVLLLTICHTPIAQFNVTDNVQCLNNNLFHFNNTSLVDTNISSSYLWKFGDGDSSVALHPSHSFKNVGTFNVKLIVSQCLCSDTLAKSLIVKPNPIAKFSVSDSVQFLNGNYFLFNNESSPSIDSLNFYWDFGDNSYSYLKNLSHSYSDTGKYNVKLVVTSGNGCKDTSTKSIEVLQAFKVDFLFDSLCYGDSAIMFLSTAIPDSIISILWDLNEDSIFNDATGSKIKIKFPANGHYRIGMKVNTAKSFSTVYKVIPIYQSPIADFLLPDYICQNQLFVIQDKTNLFGDSIIKYYWDFNNDKIIDDSSGSMVLTQYSSGGNKFIKLSVISSQGCFDSVVKSIYVSFKPNADFDVINRCVNDTAWIINKSTIFNDSIKMVFWNYGDGKDAIIKINHGHVYANPGVYNIQLIASSNYFCKDTIIKAIEIYPQPSVSLSFSDSTTIYSDQYLTVTAFGDFSSNLWSTGDTVKIITVNTKGYYKITVFSANGCKDTASFYLNILENPEFKITDVITPNDDNINDYLKIFNLDYFKPVSIRIFNRYGDLLYASDNYNNNWDAKYKGDNLPENAYFYIIKTKYGKIYKGTISVVR